MSKITVRGQASAPTTPAAGDVTVYADVTTKRLRSKDDGGVVSTYLGDTDVDGLNVGASGVNVFDAKAATPSPVTLRFNKIAQGASMLVSLAANVITVALGALTQALDGNDQDIHSIKTATFEQVVDNGNSGSGQTIDWGVGSLQKITLTDSPVALTFTAPVGVGRFQLIVYQDGTGSRLVNWPASVKWAGSAAFALSSTPNAFDVITFVYDGTDYLAVGSKNFG